MRKVPLIFYDNLSVLGQLISLNGQNYFQNKTERVVIS